MIERQINVPTADGATTTFVCHPVEALKAALTGCGTPAEVELYPKLEHGFAFQQRAACHKLSAERRWERLMALYRRRLG